MPICTKRGGCQKLDGHGGDCGRWDSAEMDWVPLDKREDISTEDTYQAFVKAAIDLATAADISDQIATDSAYPADRSPRANRLREEHYAEDLAAFRAAYAKWIGQPCATA